MRTKKDVQGYWLIGVVAALGFTFVTAKVMADRKPKPDDDNCVGTPRSNTVVVLDESERVTEQTIAEMRARALSYVMDSVPVNERVTVFTIGDLSKRSLKPAFSACRPQSEGNRLTENVKAIEKRFRERFQAPLDSALSAPPGDTRESPIAQAITDISLSQYLRGERNTLLVFSDMLENTDRFRLYGCTDAEATVARFRESRLGAVERPTFRNTRVVLNIVPRLDLSRETIRCRDSLWVWFFGDNPGDYAGVELDYLPGGQPLPQAGSSAQ